MPRKAKFGMDYANMDKGMVLAFVIAATALGISIAAYVKSK
jgi:hypothetical protein